MSDERLIDAYQEGVHDGAAVERGEQTSYNELLFAHEELSETYHRGLSDGRASVIDERATKQAAVISKCRAGADYLEGEAVDADRKGQAERAVRKRAAAATVRRYAAEIGRIMPEGWDAAEGETMAHAAHMSGILIDSRADGGGSAFPAEREVRVRLVESGWLVLVAEEGQVPFFAIAGYHDAMST